jgi:hypothetical protein
MDSETLENAFARSDGVGSMEEKKLLLRDPDPRRAVSAGKLTPTPENLIKQ